MIHVVFQEGFYWNNQRTLSLNVWYCKEVIQVTADIELNHESESGS